MATKTFPDERENILFITGNPSKLKEAKRIFEGYDRAYRIISKRCAFLEIQGTAEQIIDAKLDYTFEVFRKPLMVEDTSLCFDELGGLPGPYIKEFERAMGYEKIASLASPSCSATARCYVGFIDSDGRKHIFVGEVKGTIVSPRGSNGFGWDTIFVPEGFEKTFAELPAQEKNSMSHRKRAFEKLRRFLVTDI